MNKLFGTDGMRGEAGRFPIDEWAMRLIGRSLANRLTTALGRAPRLVVGRDTRQSGPWIEIALAEGAREAGAVCESAGVMTTPGVAFLTRSLPADAGIVISASHNPYQDNGVKIFAPDGRKLDDTMERLIEADIYAAQRTRRPDADDSAEEKFPSPVKGVAPDTASNELDLRNGVISRVFRERYLDYLAEGVAAGLRLDGLTVVADCANGAASHLAPELLERLGANVHAINNMPDGRNINRDCGSLHIDGLRRKVVEVGAAFGVAFDGDADRALFVDAGGQFVDGDATLWIMAKFMSRREGLPGECVVATVMSNIGLELALRSRGITLLRTDVGDKHVLEELLRTGAGIGGEQSGHIIFPHVSLAGDGMVTTINILRAMVESKRGLHELTEGFVRYPQVLVNVPVREKRPFTEMAEVNDRIRATESALGERGRLLLRYSGTELLARVMIEGEEQKKINDLATMLADDITRAVGTQN
ncbi:MAG TPA: phosphoglucosamine mutase [Pyrinomonadaceae bacterium]|nr:phosphoglucosamine mutase [Pyrinomonadaceae bacterium]